jgi:hypothetical protein
MMDFSTLADEVAAEIELGLAGSAQRSALRLQCLSDVAKHLSQKGLQRQLYLDPLDVSQLDIAGISTASASIPAFGGLLYGVSALAQGLRLSQNVILDSWQISRVKVDDLDYYGKDERMRWQQFRLVYEILEFLIQEKRVRTILIDLPLFISRREEATISDDAMIAEEWEEVEKQVNAFWRSHLEELFPLNPKGIIIASLRSHSATSLFSAFKKNSNTTPDQDGIELSTYIRTEWESIQQLGQSRLLDRVLVPASRSLAYSYEDLDLDPRWQPQELHQVGILGFFIHVYPKTKIWHIQVPGHRSQWSSQDLDQLGKDLIRATLYDDASALPLPLWLAKKYVRFPKELLSAYQEVIQEELSVRK